MVYRCEDNKKFNVGYDLSIIANIQNTPALQLRLEPSWGSASDHSDWSEHNIKTARYI